jgi:type I restriction enzyme M protein
MNESSLIQKVWNYATVLRNEGVHYGAYISQISFLLFLKMDEEAASQLGEPSALPADCRWSAIKDLLFRNPDQIVTPWRIDRRDLSQSPE